jgi:peptide/nickel transport system substrate-binding protein
VHLRDIVGARDVIAGKRKTATGVVARGNTLVVRLTRAAPDFSALTSLPFLCAVPPGLPVEPEGIRRLPGAGPYYVEEYRPGERVLIRRNRFYGGTRSHHVDGFDVDLRSATSGADMVQRIDRGEADWGLNTAPIFLDPALGLVPKYGINRSGSRFFLKPGLTLRMLAFNSARPLFRNNPALRKAVNFALDRKALQDAAGGPLTGVLTDQYLPPSVSGFRDADVYPLTRSNLQRARELAARNLRGGKAVLYTNNSPPPMAVGQLVAKQLAEIGLEVEVKGVPYHTGSAAYFAKLTGRDEPWDLAVVLWTPSVPDPYAYINMLLGGQHVGATNVGGFASKAYDRQMRDAARILQASERLRAYGLLDVQLARDAAPLAALSALNEPTFVSDRVGCIVLRPMLDLTAVCLN